MKVKLNYLQNKKMDTEESLKLKLKETEEKASELYQIYLSYKHIANLLRNEIQNICLHDFEIDRNQYDIDRTHFICKKCGK